ncbi:ubiquitin-like protein ISG15 [Polymixia lowei]
MDIKITMLNGQSEVLQVQPETTVASLKTLVRQRFRVSPEKRVNLTYYNGMNTSLTDDTKSLSSYGLSSGATVGLLVSDPPIPTPVQVFLKNEKGQIHTYDIPPGESVSTFKIKVKSREGVPVDQQRLIYEGKQMEDYRKLEDYNVRQGSTIFLTLRLRGG